MVSVFYRFENNIVSYKHFLFFPTMFSTGFFPRIVNPFLHMYSVYHIEANSFTKTLLIKVKLLKMSNFTFFHKVFYAICILKSFNSHISDVVCCFFEFGTVSKWCIRVRVKSAMGDNKSR